MWIDLGDIWTVVLNVAGWPAIQFAWAIFITSIPSRRFGNPRLFRFEARPQFYRHIIKIHRWKKWLPDAFTWFGIGKQKTILKSTGPDYLTMFAQEVRRGEVCHWCAIATAPIFIPWNPWWASLLQLAFGLSINLPCILSLRYARMRLQRMSTPATSSVVA